MDIAPRLLQNPKVDIAPRLLQNIPKRRVNKRTVLDALSNQTWISDIQGALTVGVISEYLALWDIVTSVQLRPEVNNAHFFVSPPMGSTQPRQPMRVFSLGRRLLSRTTEFGKPRLLQRPSSLCGWSLIEGFGQLTGCKREAWITLRAALCVIRSRKHLTIC